MEMEGGEAFTHALKHLRKIRANNGEFEFECPDTGIQWQLDYLS
jgi:hypothetical protein